MPGAAEVVEPGLRFHRGVDAAHAAVVDDVPGGVVCGAPGGRDAARGDGHNVDLVEPGGGRLPEDEVDGAEDAAAGVELRARVCEERVLVAVEAQAVVALVCGFGAEGQVLAVGIDVAERVEDVQIVL